MLQYVFSYHFSLINRVAVNAPTSTVLHKEGPQASSSPGALESSSKSYRSDQPTFGLGWHGAEHGYPNRAGPARFHLGTEPSTTRVNIPARADWCLSLHRQRDCGRQRAIRYLKVRPFRRGTNTRYVLFDTLDMSTCGSEFTGPINRIFDPINLCNFVHERTDVIPFQVKWPNKTADPLNQRPNKADSTVLKTYNIII